VSPSDEIISLLLVCYGWTVLIVAARGPAPPLILQGMWVGKQ